MAIVRVVAGVAAPTSFVGGWLAAGLRTPGYSPVTQHISDLAAIGAPARPVMTAGMVGFGLLAPLWATTLPDKRLRTAFYVAGLGTLGVAATPLEGPLGHAPHVAAAAVSYVGMALAPALGSRSLGAPRTSAGLSALAGALLVGSTFGSYAGAMQRAGLAVTDVWMAVQAVRQLRAPRARRRPTA